MGIREKLGGALEEKLNEAVDKAVENLDLDGLKSTIHEKIDALIDEKIKGLVEPLANKLKANVIDLIDGTDDLPDV